MVAAQTHANLTPRSSIGCYTDIFLGLRRGEGKGNFIAKACRSNTEAERWPAPGRAAAQRPTRNPTQSMASLRPNALFRGDYVWGFEGNSPHGSNNGSYAWRTNAV